MVYGIVKQHGDLIHVYSAPGKGTSVRVYLPFRAEQPEAVAPEHAGALVGGSERIRELARAVRQALAEKP